MTDYSLTEKTGLTREWSQGIAHAFSDPDRYLDRLCVLAAKEQSLVKAMDWDAVDLRRIEKPLRQRVANMFVQFHYGETMGLLCISRLIDSCQVSPVRKFFQSQAIDEVRHVKWLSMLIQKLECDTKVNAISERLMTEIYESDSLEKQVLGVYVFVELMAHCYCIEGERAFSNPSALQRVSSAYRSASKIIGSWMPEFIGRDESRHIAFGNYFLTKTLAQLPSHRRRALEFFAERLGAVLAEGVKHPDLEFASGMDGPAVGARIFAKVNRQLASIGLEARIPDVYGHHDAASAGR